eukprot:1183096-Prorocentrum_lima.AAC.1
MEFSSAERDGGIVRWAWGDSSPQVGKDWFQCKELYVHKKNLLLVAKAMDQLTRARWGHPLADDELREHQAVIDEHVHLHAKVPMAKGEGHSSVEHIAACLSL